MTTGVGSPTSGVTNTDTTTPPTTADDAFAQFQAQSAQMSAMDMAISDQVRSNNIIESCAKHMGEMGHV
jgi:hypothetical protein